MKFRNPQETLRKCFPKLIRKSSGKLNQESLRNVKAFRRPFCAMVLELFRSCDIFFVYLTV